MKIDGNSVLITGSLVIPIGSRAELDLPFGNFLLNFTKDAVSEISIDMDAKQIIIKDIVDSNGLSEKLTIPLFSRSANLYIAVSAIGRGSSKVHIVYYTTT